jgi:hypothetical protein
VSYQYGFSADMGGGEYVRTILDPVAPAMRYQVGEGQPFARIGDAIKQWQADAPTDAVIELMESAVYVEQIDITLGDRQSLHLRAANATRPVIRVLDWQTDLSDALSIRVGEGSRFTLDGILVTGRPIRVVGATRDDGTPAASSPCGAEIVVRHCTLVPGWGIDCDCEPKRPGEPSLELSNVRARVRIEASIVGPIHIDEDAVHTDPIPLCITDSILDATRPDRVAIGSASGTIAHAVLSIQRSTVFGMIEVHAVERAENSIFNDCLNVARRQIGCMRFCYVPPGCRTPRRYHCQPDLVDEATREKLAAGPQRDAALANQRLRVVPQFTRRRYGRPGYAQLGLDGAPEIARGADDESEMGAFHDLFQPQRTANLRARLDEYTPADMDVGILFVT